MLWCKINGNRHNQHHRGGQLFHLELSAVLTVDRRGDCRGRDRVGRVESGSGAAWFVSPHSVLSETVQVLLFPRLHEQEREGDRRIRGNDCVGSRDGQSAERGFGTKAGICLFRRWDAVLPQFTPTEISQGFPLRLIHLGHRERGDIRVRAWNLESRQGEDAGRNWHHPGVAWGRKL